jgi:hypothetical protein
MAEFKLGRIRFIWKGDWSSATVYYKDDIVRNGGNTYVCVAGHTAPVTFTDSQETYWNKISDGVDWKGDWLAATYYKVNDIVKYGGYLYIANEAHDSASSAILGLEDDQSKWDLFAEGFDYKANWAVSTRYKINDIAKYNGTIYICTQEHTSAGDLADGLELDQSKWDIFSEGFYWTDVWQTSTRYRVNDIVRFGGTLYIANTGHTSAATEAEGLENDQSKWDYLHKGIEYRSTHTANTRYRINDVVKYGGGLWICTTQHTSSATNLAADEANWAQFVEGLEFEDSWDAYKSYQPGDFVTYGGYSYVSVTNNIGLKPSDNSNDWDLFTTGFRFIGDYDDDSSSREYIEGDVVRLGGYTYLCTEKHEGFRPPNISYWELLNEGIEWKGDWTDATFYDAGDSVQYGVNSYICVLAHTSDETVAQNRPDQDVDGSEWNLLVAGAESGNLTTEGDIVYYGGAGPTRLPIGTAGQVLKVNDDADAPEWTSFGAINNVFYVETNGGVDLPAPSYGVTLDRPFKTIRYATEQVQAGAIRYNAKTLLERNRSFIQDEVIEYIEATYSDTATATTASTNAITITDTSWLVAGETAVKFAATTFGNIIADTEYYVNTILDATTFTISETKGGAIFALADATGTSAVSLSYVQATCRRDAGQVLDAVIWDLSHGGNERSVKAAKSYFNAAGDTYVADNATQTAAGLGYIVTLADAVLSNLAPATVRGSLNQYINAAFVEEADALATVTTLTGIVTSAITAGNTTNIPAERKPQNSIFVKTGQFAEVLPIVVPENTAVIGDELRSTKITPAGTLVDSADTPYTLDGISRLQAVISLAVTNPAGITKTTGNALDPVTTAPVGSAGAGTFATELVQQIYDYIDWGVNGASGDSTVPLSYGSNTPNTTTDYTYAVESLEANRAFLVQEVLAYIADTYPLYVYNTDKCARDINRYIDAIKNDLIYTGNYKSLLYARYYVNAVNGSLTEDMFYMRNGTGLRNCTVSGLSGTLGSVNAFGTKRPSAGAFVSLDPGWGPAHTDAWIINKSPYVQNVTTFGTGCIGCKIDGDLHDGGNDSIVANDFTQIISDGIGVWCTNLGRTELVSVFSYYGHIGYLAENGGKIRATNGNSSYGTFGTVAEGVDITEIPITGKVTNRAFDAIVNRVLTDGNEILVLEYANAGNNYTTATDALLTIESVSAADGDRTQGSYYGVSGSTSGSGTGQDFDIIVDEFGLATVIINKGGSGHVVADTITIADSLLGGGGAEDLTFDIATVGDATQFTVTGEGFGATVDNAQVVNGGVFEVRLTDPSDNKGGEDYISAENVAQAGNTTQITLSNTDNRVSSQYVGMAIYLVAGTGAGQYAYIDTYNSGTKIATVKKFSDDTAGWDHVIPGTAIEAALTDSTNYSIEPRVTFTAPASGLYADTAKGRAIVSDGAISNINILDPGVGYSSAPTMVLTDPNNTVDAPHEVRIGDGVLKQPTWTSRGTAFNTASAEITGDGFADIYQPGTIVRVANLTSPPLPGSNIEFLGLPGVYYKLVTVRDLIGTGPYSAQIQLSPEISITDAPEHDDIFELRIRYSQVRLTGHDFLDIGTGNFADTNYPGIPVNPVDPLKETVVGGGGRVFYTSTDQDGNFRVGRLFNVEQSTGVATLNADAFNISGLQELSLGAVELGGTGATITEFSVDGTFTANSDNIVPTQKAIKTYIASQIGGGAGELNVNSITAGSILISGQEITTTTGDQINILQKVNYTGGISGVPVALNYFLQA